MTKTKSLRRAGTGDEHGIFSWFFGQFFIHNCSCFLDNFLYKFFSWTRDKVGGILGRILGGKVGGISAKFKEKRSFFWGMFYGRCWRLCWVKFEEEM